MRARIRGRKAGGSPIHLRLLEATWRLRPGGRHRVPAFGGRAAPRPRLSPRFEGCLPQVRRPGRPRQRSAGPGRPRTTRPGIAAGVAPAQLVMPGAQSRIQPRRSRIRPIEKRSVASRSPLATAEAHVSDCLNKAKSAAGLAYYPVGLCGNSLSIALEPYDGFRDFVKLRKSTLYFFCWRPSFAQPSELTPQVLNSLEMCLIERLRLLEPR